MARTPVNQFTQMMERISQGNQSGEFVRGGGVSLATPRPTASSANIGQEVLDPPPLSAEERAFLDRQARDLGIVPSDHEGGPVMYETMEDALRAAGVDPDAPPAPTVDPVAQLAIARRTPNSVVGNAGMYRPPAEIQIVETARFPDFTKVQGMDLQKGVVYLDSMEFPIPPENLRKLRQFVVELAKRTLLAKLEEAASLFAPEVPSGSRASEGEGTTV